MVYAKSCLVYSTMLYMPTRICCYPLTSICCAGEAMLQAQSNSTAQQALAQQLSGLQGAAQASATGVNKAAQRKFSANVQQFLDSTAGLLMRH